MTSSSVKPFGEIPMKRFIYAALLVVFATATAGAQAPQQAPQPSGSAAQILTSIPANSVTITHWYKQNVYDPGDNKIGEIMDVLVDRAGKGDRAYHWRWQLSRNGRRGCGRTLRCRSSHQQG